MNSVWAGSLLCFLSVPAIAEVQLEAATRSFSIDLFLPNDASRPLERISVELDGYDISEFAALGTNKLTVNMPTPFTEGGHELSILAFFENGDIETILTETLTVAVDPEALATTWSSDLTLDGAYRVAEKDDADFAGVSSSQTDGGVRLKALVRKQGWSAKADIQALYDNNTEANANGDEFALPYINVGVEKAGDWGSAGASAGDYGVRKDGLLYNSYLRRGVAAQVDVKESLDIDVFAVNSAPTTSLRRNLSYPNDSDNRTYGTRIGVAPLSKANKKKLELEFGYLTGETVNGLGQVNDPDDMTVYGGDTWGIGVRSGWLNESLFVEAEYARSDFDSDGLDMGEGKISDSAYDLSFGLSSYGALGSGVFDQWRLELSTSEVGLYFYSLANLYLPGDLNTNKMLFQASRGGFSFSGEASRAKSNVDNDVTMPTQTTDYYSFDWYYQPFGADPNALVWSWIGTPSYNGFFRLTSLSQPDADAIKAGFDLDNDTTEASLAINFSKTRWNWGVQYTRTEFDDSSSELVDNNMVLYTPRSDSNNDLMLLQLSWTPNSYVRVSPLLQFNRLKEKQSNDTYRTEYLGFDAYAHLIPEKLILSVLYTVNQQKNDLQSLNDKSDITNKVGDFKLTWKALEPKGARPGFDLYTKGSYGRQLDKVLSDSNELWQLYLGFSLNWAKGE